MSNFEQKDNSGVLFKNDRKEEGSSHPDYQGNCMVNGKMMDMAAWLKTSKSGKKFMSFSFKPPYNKKVAGDDDTKPRGKPMPQDIEDNVPW